MSTPVCKPFPTSELIRLEPREPCGRLVESWSKYYGGATVPSKVLLGSGFNWDNCAALTGLGGGCRNGFENECNEPLLRTISVGISSIKANGVAQPSDVQTLPPLIHFEVRMGFGCAVVRVARVIWSPQSWDDSGLVVQVANILASQVELWGWCEPVLIDAEPVKIPLLLGIHMGADRSGSGDPNVLINNLGNVSGDNS